MIVHIYVTSYFISVAIRQNGTYVTVFESNMSLVLVQFHCLQYKYC